MGNKSMLRLILSAAIIIGFFLPWFSFLTSISGWDIAMQGSDTQETGQKIICYSFLLIPLFAALVLVLSLQKKAPSTLLRIAPFLVILILTVLFIIGTGGEAEYSGFLKILSFGYYITFLASLILIFIKGRDAAAA
jgi:hypothetical protein